MKRWSNAKRTPCPCGRVHASKMESRVCARLRLECQLDGATLYQQGRFPLFSLAPDDKGSASYISVDFVIVVHGCMTRAIDAKSPTRVSRDWRRGALAFEATYGIRIETVDK